MGRPQWPALRRQKPAHCSARSVLSQPRPLLVRLAINVGPFEDRRTFRMDQLLTFAPTVYHRAAIFGSASYFLNQCAASSGSFSYFGSWRGPCDRTRPAIIASTSRRGTPAYVAWPGRNSSCAALILCRNAVARRAFGMWGAKL